MEDQTNTPRWFPSLEVALPAWVTQLLPPPDLRFATTIDRVGFVIELSRLNAERGGGPFGAAVFDCQEHTLLAPGVNLVVPANWSGGHAEMVALAIAQQVLGSYDLSSAASSQYELVSSCEPCSMCYGAIPWSGVKRLVCAARKEDAEAIGFDEGPKPADWVAGLETRGIQVLRDLLRSQARQVLLDYGAQQGAIYNASGGSGN